MDSTDVVSDLSPFLIIRKNGEIQRLMGTETIHPSPEGEPKTGVKSKDVLICPETGVGARLYCPRTAAFDRKIPIMIYFHGGAFFVQSAFSPTYQNFLNALAAESNIIIVSVEYRLAPENPLPIAYNDCWDAVQWVVSHSSRKGDEPWLNNFGNFSQLFFSGDSAGGNIAHRLGIRIGLDGLDGADLSGLIMMNPYFWGKDPIGSEEDLIGVKEIMNKFWISACRTSTGSDDPWVNPCLDPDISRLGCDRVLVFVCEKDVLKHRGWLYYETLKRSGWGGEVGILEIEGEEHVFHLENSDTDKAKDMIKKVACFIKKDFIGAWSGSKTLFQSKKGNVETH